MYVASARSLRFAPHWVAQVHLRVLPAVSSLPNSLTTPHSKKKNRSVEDRTEEKMGGALSMRSAAEIEDVDDDLVS